MADPVTGLAAVLLTPQVVVHLIDLIGSLIERSACFQIGFKTNLKNVCLDLDIVKAILEKIKKRKKGSNSVEAAIRTWEEEARSVVQLPIHY
jgi:dTDP-4-dehydrorhamnose reductase